MNMVYVVLGAGVSGLTAAYELLKAGKDVVVLEKSDGIGGAIATYEINDGSHYFIEAYYHHIFPMDSRTLSMFSELGIEKNVEWLPATTAFYCNHALYELTKPTDLLFYKPLSFKNRLVMARLLFRLVREKDPMKYDNVSACEWIIKNSNKEVYNNFFSGLLSGKFSSASGGTSAGWLIGRIQLRGKRSGSGETLGYLWGGYQQLTEALVSKIKYMGGKIITSVDIKQVKVSGGVVKSVSFVKAGKRRTIKPECMISTLPPSALLSAVRLPESYKEKIDLPYQGAVCVLVGLKRGVTPYYWINMLDKTCFAALVEHTNFVKKERYGEHIVYLASYPDYSSPFWSMAEKDVFSAYFKDLQKLFPHVSEADVNWWKVSRYPKAGLVYSKGIMSRVRNIGVATPLKNLFACGMFNSLRERSVDESIKIAQLAVTEALKVSV